MLEAALLLVTGFVVSLLTSPAGVSGAFLLLPIQISLFGIAPASATASNLLYNVVATPGGIERYRREGALDLRLSGAVLTGSLPGVLIGAALRVTVFRSPQVFKAFVGVVLVALAIKLVMDASSYFARDRPGSATRTRVVTVSFVIGVIGGIYGIGGGSILAPYLVAVAGLSFRRVAGAALVGTFATSAVGLVALWLFGFGPDLVVGLALGFGGLVGTFLGAGMQKRFSENWLRILLAGVAGALGLSYLVSSVAHRGR